jgi:WD40 repeat protein
MLTLIRSRFVIAAAIATFLAPAPAHALPRSEEHAVLQKKGSQDNDSPLPKRALARMGSTSFSFTSAVIRITPDGKTAISSNLKNLIEFWHPYSGEALWKLERPDFGDDITTLALSPDGSVLCAYMGNGSFEFWDVSRREKKFAARTAGVPFFASFSPDGKMLAAEEGHNALWNAVIVREAETGKELYKIDGQWHFAFSPDGKWLATCGNDGFIHLREPRTGNVVRKFKVAENGLRNSVVFSPDSKMIAVSEARRRTTLWDVATGDELKKFAGPDNATFSPDGKTLFLGGEQKAILYDFASKKESTVADAKSHGAAFTPDGKTLVLGLPGGLHFWDLAKGAMRGPARHTGPIHALAFSPDGQILVSGSTDNTVCVWQTTTGESVFRLETKTWADGVCVSPDGKTIAAGTAGKIYLWDLARGTRLRDWDTPAQERIQAVVFSPDGKMLASWAEGSVMMNLWDVATGKEIRKIQGQSTKEFRFSGDGKQIVGMANNELVIWETGTGKRITGHSVRPFRTNPADLSSDGQRMVQWAGAKLEFKSTATGRTFLDLGLQNENDAPERGRSEFVLSADGSMVVVRVPGRGEPTLRVYEVATAKQVLSFSMPGPRSSLSISRDGKTLASVSGFTPIVWDLSPIGWDSNLAGKELTLTETAKLWDDLASEDAPAAYLAIWRLAAAGDKAVSFLKDELEPVKSTLAERLVKLTSELGAKDLATRAGAVSALERLGPAALPYLRKVLEESPPDRVRWRAERLIAKLDRPGEKYPPGGILHGESLRTLRTIQVLERNGTESARRVLADLATELEEVVETHQARASLMRLTRIH